MAAEYGAKLKWPKELETELSQYIGKPATLELQLNLGNPLEQSPVYTVDLKEGWGYDECFEGCFVYIEPIRHRWLKGEILSLKLK